MLLLTLGFVTGVLGTGDSVSRFSSGDTGAAAWVDIVIKVGLTGSVN